MRERRSHGPFQRELISLDRDIELEEPIVRLTEHNFDRLEVQFGRSFDRERSINRRHLDYMEDRAARVGRAVDNRMSTFARQREVRHQYRLEHQAVQHAANVLEADAAMAPWFQPPPPAQILADQLQADPEFQLYLNQ
jgi:hypothetical protein